MKKLLPVVFGVMLIAACEKEDEGMGQKIRFSVTGTDVNEVKFNYKSSFHNIITPFTGTRDTTIYANLGETISLDAKATGGALKGQIFVNELLATEQIDADTDGDGKAQVKVNFTIK